MSAPRIRRANACSDVGCPPDDCLTQADVDRECRRIRDKGRRLFILGDIINVTGRLENKLDFNRQKITRKSDLLAQQASTEIARVHQKVSNAKCWLDTRVDQVHRRVYDRVDRVRQTALGAQEIVFGVFHPVQAVRERLGLKDKPKKARGRAA